MVDEKSGHEFNLLESEYNRLTHPDYAYIHAFDLGIFLATDNVLEKYILCMQDVKKGDSLAMNNIGYIIKYSEEFKDKDYMEWFEKSANLENPLGMWNFAIYSKSDRKDIYIKSSNLAFLQSVHYVIKRLLNESIYYYTKTQLFNINIYSRANVIPSFKLAIIKYLSYKDDHSIKDIIYIYILTCQIEQQKNIDISHENMKQQYRIILKKEYMSAIDKIIYLPKELSNMILNFML